jgi:ubiquinone biosynthesis protein
MFADFRRHSRRQGQARYLLGVGASLLLAGVFLLTQKQYIEWGQLSLAGTGLCWLLGWFKARSRQ